MNVVFPNVCSFALDRRYEPPNGTVWQSMHGKLTKDRRQCKQNEAIGPLKDLDLTNRGVFYAPFLSIVFLLLFCPGRREKPASRALTFIPPLPPQTSIPWSPMSISRSWCSLFILLFLHLFAPIYIYTYIYYTGINLSQIQYDRRHSPTYKSSCKFVRPDE